MPWAPPSQGRRKSDSTHDPDDFAETEGGDGQIVATHFEDRDAE